MSGKLITDIAKTAADYFSEFDINGVSARNVAGHAGKTALDLAKSSFLTGFKIRNPLAYRRLFPDEYKKDVNSVTELGKSIKGEWGEFAKDPAAYLGEVSNSVKDKTGKVVDFLKDPVENTKKTAINARETFNKASITEKEKILGEGAIKGPIEVGTSIFVVFKAPKILGNLLPKGKGSADGKTGVSKNPNGVGDPVDAVTGTVIYDYIDFEIPGIIPIKWERNWYSDSKYMGALGHGYHHSYDIHIERRTDDLLLILPDGRPAFFPILTKEDNSFYNRANKLTLTLIDEKTYELYNYQEQLTYTFKGNADKYQLIKISNSDEVNVLFEYKNHCLSKITDTAGRIIKLESNGQNLITKITLQHKGEKRDLVSYAYNQAGDMITMTDALGQSTRAVYKNHLMLSKTARDGFTAYWEYDGMSTGARCIHTWCDGGILDYRIEYCEGYNVVTNSFGHQSMYYYEGNLATKIIDPLGGIIIKEYDEDQKLIKVIDEEENETTYDYDDKGNLSTINYPDKSAVEYAYDDKGRLQLITSPGGGMLARSYKNNRLDTIISPDGLMTSFKYNKKGLVSRVFDNRENETKLFYDKDNNLTKMKFPDGTQSVWEYDEWGQCTKAINPAQHQQLFSYDIMGRVTNVQLPDNNTVQLKYDSYGRILESIDKHRSISFEYTSLGSLKSRAENGKKVHFKYNKEEELIGLTNEHGEYYAFGRDVNGRIQREVGYDGITRNFQRDKAGKVLKVKRPGDKYSLYEYDKAGRISRVEHQDKTWATYDYNQDGLLIQAMNANSTVQFYRDQAGRIISEIQDGYKIDSEYGDLGLRTKIKSSLGADIDISHTDMGEVNSMTAHSAEGKIWEVGFKYNSLGMETERNLPGGISSQWTYDAAGRPQQQKVETKGGEQRKRNYRWDVNDKLQSITNQLTQGEVSFGYDDFNNLAWAQYEDGAYDYKLPDEVGNLYRSKDRKDREYGKSGKLLRSGKIRFEYDEEGNLINKITPDGKWNYNWEAGGNLKSVIRPDNTEITMEYDALGRRTAKIVSTALWGEMPEAQRQGKGMLEGDIARFIWDGNVPLHEWKYALKDRPKLVVDELGNLSKDREEPIENLTTWIFDEGTFRPAAKIVAQEQYSIITDHLGTPVEMYNAKGEKTWAVEYDMYGKIRKLAKCSVGDCPFRYQGQYEDVETGLYYNRFRYYSPDEGLYISQDPIRMDGDNSTIYAYTHDSNTWLDVFGLGESSSTQEVSSSPTNELQPTHHINKSKAKMKETFNDIKANGIKTPLAYVEHNGAKYLVDGNHRFYSAQRLGIQSVPVYQVQLPFSGYKTPADLIMTSIRHPGYWKYIK